MAYEATGYPGVFRVQQSTGMLHVVQVRVRSKEGVLTDRPSILATPVSLSVRDRTAEQIVLEVAQAVERSAGVQIGLNIPINVLRRVRVVGGAADEPALDVLVRALTASGRRLSWRLLYDPGQHMYGLNVYTVPEATGSADVP
jgi:hypothetical protein